MILIVEDEPDLADTCAMLLEAHGYEVAIADNGVNALKQIEIRMPALIVSDCKMPGMGGAELCARVRALQDGAVVPIILMSGSEELCNLGGAHCDAFLKKPFRAEQLILTARTLLDPANACLTRLRPNATTLH